MAKPSKDDAQMAKSSKNASDAATAAPLDENELNAAAADRSQQKEKDGLAHINEELDPVAHVRALEREVEAVRERLRVFSRDRRVEHGSYKVQNLVRRRNLSRLTTARDRWVSYVRDANSERQALDKEQWTLHARANAREDLQAWYHHTFSDELYRLRGPFWWREAVLPEYKHHNFAQDEDPDEDRRKAAERILCSPGTTYTAMAATMYTIRATLAEKEYALFEALTTTGVSVTKHPFRSGRPSKKTFQLSLVQGDMYLYMYLTWKGKRTSIQGVELASVLRLTRGRDTDVLRRTGKDKDSDRYLSLVTQDRSLDLCFDDEDGRELWWRTMTALVDVERAVRAAASGPDSPPPPPPPNAPKPP